MKTVGAYEYDEKDEIGRGAFGSVYKGRNKTNFQEVVAIKEVAFNAHNDFTTREIEILKTLSNEGHRNIVTLLHCEFCNGGSLTEYIKSKQKLDERTVITFLQQICAGLKFVHDMHIIHRDLKPDNILLCFSGPIYPSPDNITLKIASFEIGRFLHSDEMARTNCGTLPYMAPEILLHRPGGYDYKVDLWSIGVIAYECLVGSLPKNLIALNGFQIPTNATKDFANLLQGLLENDEKKRLTLKHVLDFQFDCPVPNISVIVYGSTEKGKIIHFNDNQSVDHLIDIVFATFNVDPEDFYLLHGGAPLERGTSIRDSCIERMDSLHLCCYIRGGLVMDGSTLYQGKQSAEMLWTVQMLQL